MTYFVSTQIKDNISYLKDLLLRCVYIVINHNIDLLRFNAGVKSLGFIRSALGIPECCLLIIIQY